ncbi:alpha/beta hydrolase [Amycolatopsis pigmentata]|uniref:Alpha/beta hydrolase n=1 Tax=Amycolatopsis pigmentata TaxID=450801 RepID=A0ABW5FN10_9PSEU
MGQYTDFLGPQELRTRGTIIVVPGRGETRETYTRLGKRLAADAYRVRIVDAPRIDEADVKGSLARLADELAIAAETTEDGEPRRPVVLLGADSGAATVTALIEGTVEGGWSDAVVLAGLPGRAVGVTTSWDEELDIRTSCAVHRGVLSGDAAVERGTLGVPLPDDLLDIAYAGTSEIPQLVLIGDADPLADREALARAVKTSKAARLSVVRGAHHDVLNDLQHRSVAAEIVSFLETLRNDLVPLISVESSAW